MDYTKIEAQIEYHASLGEYAKAAAMAEPYARSLKDAGHTHDARRWLNRAAYWAGRCRDNQPRSAAPPQEMVNVYFVCARGCDGKLEYTMPIDRHAELEDALDHVQELGGAQYYGVAAVPMKSDEARERAA
jgi:hypothetical protein